MSLSRPYFERVRAWLARLAFSMAKRRIGIRYHSSVGFYLNCFSAVLVETQNGQKYWCAVRCMGVAEDQLITLVAMQNGEKDPYSSVFPQSFHVGLKSNGDIL